MSDVRRLFLFPLATENPYLMMCTLAAEAAGWQTEGDRYVDRLAAAVDERLGAGDVVHINWTAHVTAKAAALDEAMANVERFERILERARAKGVHVLWTVHNEFAHDAQFVEAEQAVIAALIRWSTRIIQLHDRTREHLARSYDLPADRLVTLRHASYAGIYPAAPSAEDARRALGVPLGVPTVGLVGQIRPYKGVDVLLAAAAVAARTLSDLTVLIAGRTSREQLLEIEAMLPEGVTVVRNHEYLDDADIAHWIQAANVIALPYRRILNSGSALLAATLGRPVVLPDDSPLVRVYADQPWVASYSVSPDPVGSLAEQLVRLAPGDPALEAAALDFAASYTPYDMSRDYLRLLEAL